MKPFDEAVVPPGVLTQDVTAWRSGRAMQHPDWLAEEVPVALVFNGISHAVMLVSPDQLEDFALGFGLTEGLLADASELYGSDIQQTARWPRSSPTWRWRRATTTRPSRPCVRSP